MAIWRAFKKDEVASFFFNLSETIAEKERATPALLPDFSKEERLALISDYSGDHTDSEFYVLSYLLFAWNDSFWDWDDARKKLRTESKLGKRAMDFKGLTDSVKQMALVPFLQAANILNGILFTVVIEKTISFSKAYTSSTDEMRLFDGFVNTWKEDVLERLTRIGMFGSFIVGGLSHSGQMLHWVTDNDNIAPNEEFQKDTSHLFGRFLATLCPKDMGPISFGISGKYQDEMLAEDLVGIADLAAGTMSECMNAYGAERIPRSTNLSVPMKKPLSTKSGAILSWYGELDHPLKRLMCLIRSENDDMIRFSFGTPFARKPFPGEVQHPFVPLSKNWERALRPRP
jgi:hypothetical protein